MTLKTKIKFFKEEVNYWIDYFGFYDWELDFEEETDENNRASLATGSNNKEFDSDRIATIFYEKGWLKEENNKKQIAKISFHEVIELMLSKLRDFSINRSTYISEREVDDEIHRIVKIMENKVFDKLYKEKKS
jgi:hypothetical protein